MYYFLCPENKKKIKLKGLTLRHHISSFSSTRTNKRHELKYWTFRIYKYWCYHYVTTHKYGWFKCYCVLNNVTRIVCSVLQLEYSGWESVLKRFYHGFIFFHDYFLSLFEDDRGDTDRKWEGGGGGGVQQKSLAGFKPRMQLCSYVRISPCVSFVVMLHGQTKERSSCEIHVCAQISRYPHSAL